MNTKNKSNLLLIELILAILFFSMTVSICVKVIFTAHEIGRQNSVLTKATITGDSIVSIFKEQNIDEADKIMAENFKSVKDDKGWNLYFDREFNICSNENARYIMTVQISETSSYLRNVIIHLNDLQPTKENADSLVYSLNTANFIQGGDN